MGATSEIPLDVEGVEIKDVELTEKDGFFITVTSTVEGTNCHVCNQRITDFYGQDREVILRHLSILGTPTFIKSGQKDIAV